MTGPFRKLTEIWKYLLVGILSGLLQYFPKNRAIFVQKLGGRKKLSKSNSGYFMTKKKQKKRSNGHLVRGGGGKALMAQPLREELFLRLPIVELYIK